MPVNFYLCAVLLVFLGDNSRSCNQGEYKKVIVIGTALDEKDGAVVETDKFVYLLDGLDAWDEKYYGKKVKVTGRSKIEYHEKQSTDSVLVQERVGVWRIIKHPKWSLVE